MDKNGPLDQNAIYDRKYALPGRMHIKDVAWVIAGLYALLVAVDTILWAVRFFDINDYGGARNVIGILSLLIGAISLTCLCVGLLTECAVLLIPYLAAQAVDVPLRIAVFAIHVVSAIESGALLSFFNTLSFFIYAITLVFLCSSLLVVYKCYSFFREQIKSPKKQTEIVSYREELPVAAENMLESAAFTAATPEQSYDPQQRVAVDSESPDVSAAPLLTSDTEKQ